METHDAYNIWAIQYDSNDNKTRDLEAIALRSTLEDIPFARCLEIGCGTGKNTGWFVEKAFEVTAIDFSEEMLAKAKAKVTSERVEFKQADILLEWEFRTRMYDLVSFSLVLEHVEHLDPIFRQVSEALLKGGHVYIGELHPFKQYTGSKARFESEKGTQLVPCFDHHISDFTNTAKRYGLKLLDINEFFDNDDRTGIPRILTLLLAKME